jgi:hypothetical protein
MSGQNSDGSRNYEKPVSTRLTSQKKRQFDQFREENELGSTEALRQLVDDGLEANEDGKEIVTSKHVVNRNTLSLTSIFAGFVYIIVMLLESESLGAAVGGSFILVILLWANWIIVTETFR